MNTSDHVAEPRGLSGEQDSGKGGSGGGSKESGEEQKQKLEDHPAVKAQHSDDPEERAMHGYTDDTSAIQAD
jgi:hypothetical protein